MRRVLAHHRAPDVAFAGICLFGLALLLWLGSGLTFTKDEWALIAAADDWSVDALLQPHNQHFMPLLRAVWNGLMATVGLRSYLPYLLVDYLLIVAAATAIYVYGRRQTHALIAIAAGTTFLLLGTGAENLFLSFQMGWTGAAAAGLWALVLLLREPRPRHGWLVSAFLVLGILATGTFTLPFIAAVAAAIVITPRLHRLWWVVLPATAIYGAWYLAYGRGSGPDLPPLNVVVTFVENGLSHAAGRILAAGADVGLIIVVLLALAALGDAALRRRPRLGLITGVTGLGTLWLLIGLGRAADLPETFTAPRYIHISAPFLLVAILGWLAQRRIRRPAQPLRLALVVAVIAAVIIGWNVNSLFRFRSVWAAEADAYRAAISILLTHGGSPDLPADRGLLRGPNRSFLAAPDGARPLLPSAHELAALIEHRGSPLSDPLGRGNLIPPADVTDRILVDVIGDALRVEPSSGIVPGTRPEVEASHGMTVTESGSCVVSTPTSSGASIDLRMAPRGRLEITSDADGSAALTLSSNGAFAGSERDIELGATAPRLITLPDVGADTVWWLRLRLEADGETRLCGAASP